MRAPARSSASHVATLASWSRWMTTISGRGPRVWPTARLIERMNDVALRPNAISSALCALTNAATLSRARAIIASTSRERRYGPPRWTLRVRRCSVTASRTLDGICAPAALSKNTKRPACSSGGNRRRTSSTGKGREAPSGKEREASPGKEREASPGKEREASPGKEREALAERSVMGVAARARVCDGHEPQEWEEPHDTVLEAVDEERRRGNRRKRDDTEPRGQPMRRQSNRKPREMLARQRRSKVQIRDENDDPDEQHAGHRRAVEGEKCVGRREDCKQAPRRAAGARRGNGAQGPARAADHRKRCRRIPGPRQRQQHPRRHVEIRVRARERRGNHDEIHRACRGGNPHRRKRAHE